MALPQKQNTSILQQRADAVSRCLTELEKANHSVISITIMEHKAMILIEENANCKKLHARDLGVFNTPKGLFTLMELCIFGVHVQYFRPYQLYVVKPPRVH